MRNSQTGTSVKVLETDLVIRSIYSYVNDVDDLMRVRLVLACVRLLKANFLLNPSLLNTTKHNDV